MRIIITVALMLVTTLAFSQRRSRDYNRIGFLGGYNIMEFQDSDLDLESDGGFFVGVETRGTFYNYFDMIYGFTFWKGNFKSEGNGGAELSQLGGQLKLLGSYNIIDQHLSVEFGPALRFNGNLKIEDQMTVDSLLSNDEFESNLIGGDLILGISAGIEQVRFIAQYHYGLTDSVKSSEIEAKPTMILLGLVVYL